MEYKIFNSQIEFHKYYMDEFLSSNDNEFKITVLDRTEALYGGEQTIDKNYCDKHNIPYSQGKLIQNTGCIIGVKGNILLDIKRKFNGGECICDKFSKTLVEYFKSKGMNSVRQDNNDVLVDDFKVASGAEVSLENGFQYVAYQISIYQDLETIKHACKKPMIKIPKALNEYGITTEEMLKFVKEYWNKN